MQTAPSVVICLDREYRILEFNPEAERLFGRKRANVLGKDYLELFLPDNAREAVAADIEKVLAGVPTRGFENTVMTKDKQERILRWNVDRMLDFEDKPASVVAFGQDITEHKKAEESLRESEMTARAFLDATTDSGLLIDREGLIIDLNDNMVRRLGRKRKDMIGTVIYDYLPPDLAEQRKAIGLEAASTKKPVRFEDRRENSWFENSVYPIFDPKGQVDRFAIFSRDITERKKAEQTLRESEEHLKILFESAPDGIYLINVKGNFVDGNKAAEEMTGYPREELIGKNFAESGLLLPEQVPKAIASLEKNAMGEPTGPDEFTLKRKDGSYVTVEIRTFPVRIGNQTLSLGIARDISERKKVEKELQESEERFRTLSNAAFEGIAITEQGRIVDANATFTDLFGYHFDEIIGKGVGILVAPEDRKLVVERIRSGYEKPYEHKALRKDGSVLDIEVCGRSVLYKGRECRITAIRDITEYKRARETLRENEMRFRQLVENIREVFWMENADGTELFYVSPAYEEIWGRYCEEFYKNPRVWIDAIHPDDRQRVEDAFAKGRLDGTYSEEFRIIRPDGAMRWIWDRNVVIRDELGNTQHIAGVAEDITERKQAEKTLITYQNDLRSLASKLTSTEEFQRRQIAADLHDNVSQTLALSVNQLRRLRKSTASGDAKILDEICQMTEKVIQNVQDLTFDLASPTLYKIGLEAAISELLSEQLRDRHGIACKFSDDKKDKPLDDNIRVLLFQAVRELLVNVIKHAKAHEVEVAIQRENNKIQISVSDDGVGFDIQEAETSIERSGGFGLFNIRERIDYIDGSFEIHSQPGSGSRFIVTAPIKTKTDLSLERYDGS